MRTRRRSWDLPETEVTPEAIAFGRRRFLEAGAGGLALGLLGRVGGVRAAPIGSPLAAAANPHYAVDGATTPEAIAGAYNNFYEFGFSKSVAGASRRLKTNPWRLSVDGLCDAPFEADLDDLLKSVTLEERVYRLRCVEAWSMVIPWTGFPLAEIVKRASPKASAKYVRFESFLDRTAAPMQGAAQYPWPYVEGLTLAEATNDLAFLAIGAYGKVMPTQHGAPIRLVTPWKYGFKSAKSIVRISFVEKRPQTFWMTLGEEEYGFFANVNPKVAHPRWSQAQERRVDTDEMVPTRLFNGYEAEVADLYRGMEKERIFY